jgi:hypothetical protein
MARIRSRGNRDTELALARLLRAHGITGWRRQGLLRATVDGRWLRVDGKKVEQGKARSPLRAVARSRRHGAHGVTRPTFQVRSDFVFPSSSWRCLWTAVSGTAARSTRRGRRRSGLRKSSMPARAGSRSGRSPLRVVARSRRHGAHGVTRPTFQVRSDSRLEGRRGVAPAGLVPFISRYPGRHCVCLGRLSVGLGLTGTRPFGPRGPSASPNSFRCFPSGSSQPLAAMARPRRLLRLDSCPFVFIRGRIP